MDNKSIDDKVDGVESGNALQGLYDGLKYSERIADSRLNALVKWPEIEGAELPEPENYKRLVREARFAKERIGMIRGLIEQGETLARDMQFTDASYLFEEAEDIAQYQLRNRFISDVIKRGFKDLQEEIGKDAYR